MDTLRITALTADTSPPKRSHNLIVRLFQSRLNPGVFLYGGGATALLLVSLLIGESSPMIGLYNTVGYLLWLGCIPLLILSLLLRRWLLVLLLILPLVALFHFYNWTLFSSGERDPYFGDENTLTVLTHNLYFPRSDFTGSINVIKQSGADIVALQELSITAATQVQAALADDYPYLALHGERSGALGQGLLSKYPIIEEDYYFDDFLAFSFGQQRAEIDFNDETLVIYNVHLLHPLMGRSFDVTSRGMQVEDLLQRTAGETDPVIILGDFNMSDLSADYFRLTDAFRDTFRQGGNGFGWTHALGSSRVQLPPLMRLDYIFTRGSGFHVLESWVSEDNGGSDHSPVITKLEIYDPTLTLPR